MQELVGYGRGQVLSAVDGLLSTKWLNPNGASGTAPLHPSADVVH